MIKRTFRLTKEKYALTKIVITLGAICDNLKQCLTWKLYQMISHIKKCHATKTFHFFSVYQTAYMHDIFKGCTKVSVNCEVTFISIHMIFEINQSQLILMCNTS